MNREHIHLTLVGAPTLGEELLLGGLEGLDPLKQLLDEGLFEENEESQRPSTYADVDEVSKEELEAGASDLEWVKAGLVKNLSNLSTLELQNEFLKRLGVLNEAALRLGFYQKDLQTYFSLDLD